MLEDEGTLGTDGDPLTDHKDELWETQEDVYQEDLRFSLGLLGKAYSGHLCQTQAKEAPRPKSAKPCRGSVTYGCKSIIWEHGLKHNLHSTAGVGDCQCAGSQEEIG